MYVAGTMHSVLIKGGILISRVLLHTSLCSWDHHAYYFHYTKMYMCTHGSTCDLIGTHTHTHIYTCIMINNKAHINASLVSITSTIRFTLWVHAHTLLASGTRTCLRHSYAKMSCFARLTRFISWWWLKQAVLIKPCGRQYGIIESSCSHGAHRKHIVLACEHS